MGIRIDHWLVAAALVLAGCAADTQARPCSAPGGCDGIAAGVEISNTESPGAAIEVTCAPGDATCRMRDFATFTTQPGEEVLGKCRSWTLDNPEPLYINSIEMEQTEGSHHSDWTFVPQALFDGPDGVWNCDEREYRIFPAARAGGILFAQSTQVKKEAQTFPPGVAIRIPPYSRLIGDVHLFNASSKPITGNMRLTLRLLSESEVRVRLSSFHASYDALALPPRSPSRFTGNCSVATELSTATGSPFSMRVYYVLPHAHYLVTRAFASVFGGPNHGAPLLDIGSYDGTGNGRMLDPPVDMTGADGFTFGCEYLNTGDKTIKWGFSDGEMCELFGFADLPIGFHTWVDNAPQDGTVDGMPHFVGSCVMETLAPPP